MKELAISPAERRMYMTEEPHDLSFQQAKQRKIAEFTAEIRQHVEQRLDFLQRGVTVAEAVVDIRDVHLRQAVQGGLLYGHDLSLSDGLCNLGVLTRAQADELSLYLIPISILCSKIKERKICSYTMWKGMNIKHGTSNHTSGLPSVGG